MQHIHAEGSVRHAEKRRRGTCQFANRIARTSLDAYERSVPQSYREANKQTCVASIVAHFHHQNGSICSATNDNIDDEGVDDTNLHLQVMGLGVGTKFLPDAIIREEQSATFEDGYGKRIRDCHAEVLARRAFRCQIALEILSDLNSNGEEQGDAVSDDSSLGACYSRVLERIDSCNYNGSDDDKRNATTSIRYQLRSDVTLHFYASSAPCGNAVLKKFIKMQKETFDESLGPDDWPDERHAPIAAHSLRLGQFALLVKKDGSISQSEPTEDNIEPPSTQHQKDSPGREKKLRKPWPCRESDSWCPPSCSITGFDKGTIHSCSDKICRWNCLGMQGSLLMPVLDGPLHMTTLTVGRKFSRAICSRAVCCRADGFGSRITSKGNDDDKNAENSSKYKLNHPTLMETNVYMDEAGTHVMAGVKSVGEDAIFDSNLCWVWWPEKASDFGYAADCLDGKTGLKINYHDNADLEKEDGMPPSFTACSTFSLFQLNMEILQRSGVPNMSWKSQTKLSLSDIRRMKCQISSQYESAKIDFFRHRVFDQWSRRDCS